MPQPPTGCGSVQQRSHGHLNLETGPSSPPPWNLMLILTGNILIYFDIILQVFSPEFPFFFKPALTFSS